MDRARDTCEMEPRGFLEAGGISRNTLTGRLLIGVAAIALMAGSTAGARTTPEASASAEPKQLPFADELQRVLDDGVHASDGLGVTAAVIAAGYEPWTGAAGHSIRSNDALIPMRPEMLFEIGSVDRNLVTVIMLQLVAEGRISLEDPVREWLPDYPQIPPAAMMRDLIASTSGIAEWVDHPSSVFQPPFDPKRLARSWTVDEMLTELVGPPEFAPGGKWRYSTTGFVLARAIIERETGQSIADLIQAPARAAWHQGHVADAGLADPVTLSGRPRVVRHQR
jgi:D-alanyl-D-alanine carboxypeptidase